jgi:hypothetical protein
MIRKKVIHKEVANLGFSQKSWIKESFKESPQAKIIWIQKRRRKKKKVIWMNNKTMRQINGVHTLIS